MNYKNSNTKKISWLTRFLMAIISIPLVILSMMGTVMAVGLYYDLRFSEDVVYFITSKLSLFPIVFSFSVLMYILLKIMRENDRFLQKITLVGIMIGLILGIASLMFFNKFTLDGIYTYSVFGNKVYSFEDVKNFNLSDGSDGVLKIEFEMEDGKKVSLMGDTLDAVSYNSRNIDEYYTEDSAKEYIIDIAKILKENNVPLNFDIKELEKEVEFDYWLDIADEILLIYGEN